MFPFVRGFARTARFTKSCSIVRKRRDFVRRFSGNSGKRRSPRRVRPLADKIDPKRRPRMKELPALGGIGGIFLHRQFILVAAHPTRRTRRNWKFFSAVVR